MTTTLLEEPVVRPTISSSQRLRATMAAVRISFTWLGVRKTLTAEQRAEAAEPFGANVQFLTAGKKLLDISHPAYRAVTAVRGKVQAFWKSQSLPYPEPGIRLIRQDGISDFAAKMRMVRGWDRFRSHAGSKPWTPNANGWRRTGCPQRTEPVQGLVPLDLLDASEGSRADPVQLNFTATDKVTASCTDKQVPVVLEFATSTPDDTLPPFPPVPETFANNEPGLWTALREAAATTDQQPHRFALNCVQLCGTSGKIVATDGQQALVQSGFQFPWSEDLLIPASGVFGCRVLPGDQQIQVGKTEDWVTFRSGSWTISLKLEKDARFPDVTRTSAIRPRLPRIFTSRTTTGTF